MKLYKNQSKDSGVIGYEIGNTFIRIKFTGDQMYTYSYKSTGKTHVEAMKKLAENGKGLSTYISQYVHDRFEKK